MALNSNVVAEQNAKLDELVHTPTFLVVAGALPGVFVATSYANGAAIGFVCAIAIIAAALISRAVAGITGVFTRVPVALMLNALVVVLLGFAVRVLDPVVYQDLGVYLPLACTSGIAGLFIAQGGVAAVEGDERAGLTLRDACFAAGATFIALFFVGFMCGMLTTGEVFGLTMHELASSPIAIFGKPAGGLLMLALVAAFVQACDDVRAAGKAKKEEDR